MKLFQFDKFKRHNPDSSLMQLRVRITSSICAGFCLVAFAFSFFSALQLKMHSEIPFWVWHAVSPAFSKVVFDAPRYKTLNSVYDKFIDGTIVGTSYSINGSLDDFLKSKSSLDTSARIFPSPDDKGIVIFTELAFRIFGLKIEGVLFLYYMVLGFSGLIFTFAYRRNPYALLVLAGFYACHCLMLPMIKYDLELNGITALRCFPILGMVALLHCILFFFQRKVTRIDLALISLQIALIVFIIFIRSTALWELAVVVIMSVFALFCKKGPTLEVEGSSKLMSRFPSLYALCISLIFFGLLKAYISFGLPSEYYAKDQLATRAFWHNIYSGFAYNPVLASREQLKVDDYSIVEKSRRYLLEKNRENEWQEIIGSSKNDLPYDWNKYEIVIREALFDLCEKDSLQCALTFLWYKPISLAKNLLWVYGIKNNPADMDVFTSSNAGIGTKVRERFLLATQKLDEHYDRGIYLALKIFGIILIFLMVPIVYANQRQVHATLCSVGILMLGSTIPSLIGYPAPHTVGEAALAFTLFGISLFLLLGLRIANAARVTRS